MTRPKVILTRRWPAEVEAAIAARYDLEVNQEDRPLDAAALRAAVTDRTTMIVLNTPHNPTGAVLSTAELESVAQVARDHDLVVLSDEVYEHLVYDGRPHRPLCTFDGMAERTVTISSAGKTFSLTGWKIGWATGPADLVRAVMTAKQFLAWLATPEGRRASPELLQRRFTFLRLRFNVVLTHFDIFAEALTQRSEHETGVFVAGLDAVAADALELPGVTRECGS